MTDDTHTADTETVVRSFYGDWDEVGFREAYIRHLHPDVLQQNTGIPDRKGLEAVLESLERYLERFRRPFCRVEIKNIAVNGNTVFTERKETCYSRNHNDVHVGHLASVFVVEGNKIIRWAEFWDPSPYRFGSALPDPASYTVDC